MWPSMQLVRAMRLTPRPADFRWAAVRTHVRQWPVYSIIGEADVEQQLMQWAAQVRRHEDQIVQHRKAAWDAWVKRILAEPGGAEVHRFMPGPVVPFTPSVAPSRVQQLDLEGGQVQRIQRAARPWQTLDGV